MVAWAQADYARAAQWCDESLTLFRQINDWRGVALALSYVARVALERGDYDRTTEASDEAVALYEALGDAWGGHFSRAMHVRVAWAQGNYDGAAALLEEEIRAIRPLGDQRGIGFLQAYLNSDAATPRPGPRGNRRASRVCRDGERTPTPPRSGDRAGHRTAASWRMSEGPLLTSHRIRTPVAY